MIYHAQPRSWSAGSARFSADHRSHAITYSSPLISALQKYGLFCQVYEITGGDLVMPLARSHVRTALFVDFDNMYLNLKGIDPAAGEAFATERAGKS